jgi:hypothetical protein
MESYDTLTDAINALRQQGYTEDFNLANDCIECRKGDYKLAHNEFGIDKSFRFDVNEDPSDQSVVYAISSPDHNVKGLLVNGYGVYSDTMSNALLAKLK